MAAIVSRIFLFVIVLLGIGANEAYTQQTFKWQTFDIPKQLPEEYYGAGCEYHLPGSAAKSVFVGGFGMVGDVGVVRINGAWERLLCSGEGKKKYVYENGKYFVVIKDTGSNLEGMTAVITITEKRTGIEKSLNVIGACGT